MAFTENSVQITDYFAKLSDYSQFLPQTGTVAVGNNSYGQLGRGNTTHFSSPVQVSGPSHSYQDVIFTRNGRTSIFAADSSIYFSGEYLHKWKSIAHSSGSYSMAIKTDGTLWSWGSNGYGELGLSNTIARSSPVQVGALTNWSQVTSGKYHTAAIKTDGTLWSWGYNYFGQLGLSDQTHRSSPVQVGNLTNWSNLAIVEPRSTKPNLANSDSPRSRFATMAYPRVFLGSASVRME